jgi:hypothetical protein
LCGVWLFCFLLRIAGEHVHSEHGAVPQLVRCDLRRKARAAPQVRESWISKRFGWHYHTRVNQWLCRFVDFFSFLRTDVARSTFVLRIISRITEFHLV